MKKQRMTKQKKIILDILRSTTSHPTADWIYEKAKKEIPELSLGTVYRNLKIMKESGEILELDYGSTQSHFDGNSENHYHFMCEKCGKIYDLDMPVKIDLEEEVKEKFNHDVKFHRLEFFGICNNCKNACE